MMWRIFMSFLGMGGEFMEHLGPLLFVHFMVPSRVNMVTVNCTDIGRCVVQMGL